MRQALLEQLPALSHFYPGITPSEVDRMTLREMSEYVSWMNQYTEAEREAVRRDG